MDKNLENEIQDLIDKSITSKKTQFGKSYSELGTSDSNLILRTKGDIKIQWGGKFIDLLKNGKINTESSIDLKYIQDESKIGSANGIYITEDNQIFIGNSSKHININQDISSFISFMEEQQLNEEQFSRVLKNIGLIFETKQAVLDSKLTEGLVYILEDSAPYIYKNQLLTPIIQNNPVQSNAEFDTLTVNTINSNQTIKIDAPLSTQTLFSDNIQVNTLNVKYLEIEAESVESKNLLEDLIIGDTLSDTDIFGLNIYGKITNINNDIISLNNNDIQYQYQIVYYEDEGDIFKSAICIKQKNTSNNLSFNSEILQNCVITESTLNLPYFTIEPLEVQYYTDNECTIPLNLKIFNAEGIINNTTLNLSDVNWEGNINLNNCVLNGTLVQQVEDTTPEEILNILASNQYKEIYYDNDCFHLKKLLPKNSIILCANPDIPVSSVSFSLTIPSINVLNNNEEVIGTTESVTLEVPITQILVNSNTFSWQLL